MVMPWRRMASSERGDDTTNLWLESMWTWVRDVTEVLIMYV